MNPQPRDARSALRRRKIFEYCAMLALLLAMAGLYFLGRGREGRQEQIFARSGLELQGGFFASRFENGALSFSLQGRDFNYYPDQGRAEMSEPSVKIFALEETVLVKGKTARFLAKTRRIEIEDQVEVRVRDYLAQTPALSCDLDQRICRGEKQIAVSGRGVELTGQGYIFDLGRGRIKILSGVKGKFKQEP